MKSPEWLSATYRRDGDRWARCLTAYWMLCPVHSRLIPRGMGESLACPECPTGREHLHKGQYVAVQFVSRYRIRVDEAMRRARELSPALYPRGETVFDLDDGDRFMSESTPREP